MKPLGMYGKEPPTVWVRAVAYHTYDGIPQPEGSFYLAHEYMIETLENPAHRLAVREPAPHRARRESSEP